MVYIASSLSNPKPLDSSSDEQSSQKDSSLVDDNVPKDSLRSKLPVLLQTLYITGCNSNKIVDLLDLCLTNDYITHIFTKNHNMHGYPVIIKIFRINKKNTILESQINKDPNFTEFYIILRAHGSDNQGGGTKPLISRQNTPSPDKSPPGFA